MSLLKKAEALHQGTLQLLNELSSSVAKWMFLGVLP